MPYIPQDQRSELDWELDCLIDELKLLISKYPDKDAGILNYTISQILISMIAPDISYSKINSAIGVLECVKLELYRRMGSPYEDRAIDKNGDLFWYKFLQRGG